MIESAAKCATNLLHKAELGDHQCAEHLGHATGPLPSLHIIAALDHH